jgi:hypothetical protein
MRFNIHSAPHKVIMDMVTINMRSEDVGILPAEDFISQLFTDLMRLFRSSFPWGERLDQVPPDGFSASSGFVQKKLELDCSRLGDTMF